MTEADFEREATQLFRDLGLQLDPGTLSFFQSDDRRASEGEWKSGLKKPSQPRVRRRTAPSRPGKEKENTPKQLNGTNNSYRKLQEPVVLAPPPRSPSSRRKYQTRATVIQSDEKKDQREASGRSSARERKHSHPEASHIPTVTTRSTSEASTNSSVRRASSPNVGGAMNGNARMHTSTARTTQIHHRSASGTVLNGTDSSLQTAPLSKGGYLTTATNGFSAKMDETIAAANGERKTSSSTQVVYDRKPSLKIISVSTSSSSIVHTVKDRSGHASQSRRPAGQDTTGMASRIPRVPKPSTQGVQRKQTKETSQPGFAPCDDYDHLSSPEPMKASSGSSASSRPTSASLDVTPEVGSSNQLQEEKGLCTSNSRRWTTPESGRSNSVTPSGSRSSVERFTSPEVGDMERETTPTSADDADTSPEPTELQLLEGSSEKSTLLDVNFKRASLGRTNKRVNACATTTVRALSNLMEVLTPSADKVFKLDVGDSPTSPIPKLTLTEEPNSEEDDEFYGYCAKCGEAVIGMKNGCLALDDIFHLQCFTCTRCMGCLSGQNFYIVRNEVLCEADYLTTLDVCHMCQMKITERVLKALGHSYHPHCFCCDVCGMCLDGIPYASDSTEKVYCTPDFHRQTGNEASCKYKLVDASESAEVSMRVFAPKCAACQKPIAPEPGRVKTVRVIAMKKCFHMECYRCEDCGMQLASRPQGGEKCYPLDNHLLCKSCNTARAQGLPTRTTVL